MSEVWPYLPLGRTGPAQGGSLPLYHVLEGLSLRFRGTALSFRCGGEAGKLAVFCGERAQTVLVRGDTAVSLTFPEGEHAVRLIKASSPRYGALNLDMGSINCEGISLPPPKKRETIAFLGDSVSAGCGAAATCAEREQTVENSDATLAFPFLTAEALGMQAEVLAYEGMAVRDSSPCGYGLLREAECDSSAPIAVVAFGENDMWHAASPDFPNYNILKFIEDYADMVRLVHAKYPRARLFCLYGMMPASSTEEAERAILSAIAKSGAAAVPVKAVSDEAGGNLHPCAAAHRETARRLLKLIKSPTG